MARVCDGTDVPAFPVPASFSNLGSPTGSLPDLEGTGYRARTMEEKINEIYLQLPLLMHKTRLGLKIASRRLLKQWPPRRLRSQKLNKLFGASWLGLPLWKQVQPLAPVALNRQDLGIYSDIVMAPQPLGLSGPMAQGHRMTTGMRDADLILSQALKMNMRESLVNNTTLGLRIGSIMFQSPTHQPVTNLSEYIAKQVPCQSDSYSKQEPNVRTLWPYTRMMVSTHDVDSPFCQSRTSITDRQSKSLEDR